MKAFKRSWPEKFYRIARKVEKQAVTKSHIKEAGIKMYATNLIFSRVIWLQTRSRNKTFDNILDHKMVPVPTLMFGDTGDIRIEKTIMKKQQVKSRAWQATSRNYLFSDRWIRSSLMLAWWCYCEWLHNQFRNIH